MTQDEIQHMWKVASNDPHHDTNWHDPVVMAFAKLVAAKAIAELESQELKQVTVKDFVHMVEGKEDLIGRPVCFAQWPNGNTHPPQRTEERNFCPRCGKRAKDSTHIHTCTPPQD